MNMNQPHVSDKSLYRDTKMLLRQYRDVSWNLELSVQKARQQFQVDYGSSVDDFLESIYVIGLDFTDHEIAEQVRSIERSHRMMVLMEQSVNLLREKHKNGEEYYWILFYSYLSPQKYHDADAVIGQLAPHIKKLSHRTYYRKRQEAVKALSSILWGYSSQESKEILTRFFSEDETGT